MIYISNADRDKAVEYIKAYATLIQQQGITTTRDINKRTQAGFEFSQEVRTKENHKVITIQIKEDMEKTLNIFNDVMKAHEWLETFTAVYKALIVCLSQNTKAEYNGDNWFVYASGSPWHTNELGDIMNLNHDQEDIYVKGDIEDIAFKFTRLIMADGCTAANVYTGQ